MDENGDGTIRYRYRIGDEKLKTNLILILGKRRGPVVGGSELVRSGSSQLGRRQKIMKDLRTGFAS